MTRAQRAEVRRLAREAQLMQARRERALFLLGRCVLVGDLTVAEVAREVGLSARSVRRYRDRAAVLLAGTFSAPSRAPGDISGRAGRVSGAARRGAALRALQAMAVNGVAPAVRTYRRNRRYYGAPSMAGIAAEFGSWRAAVLEADLVPREVGRPRSRRVVSSAAAREDTRGCVRGAAAPTRLQAVRHPLDSPERGA